MKSLRLIIMLAAIALTAGVITWFAISYEPVPEAGGRGTESKQPGEANEPADKTEAQAGKGPEKKDVGEKKEEDKSEEAEAAGEEKAKNAEGVERPGEGEKKAAEGEEKEQAEQAEDANEPLENANLKEVEMKKIIDKLAEWTGKVIIPTKEAMGKKITIYSRKELPRSRVLSLIYSSLRMQGIVAESTDDTIYLKELKDAKVMSVPVIPTDMPLASLKNKNEVVQKFFRIENYSATQIVELIKPFVDDYGYVGAEESTSKVLVIDTVQNLIRVQAVIDQFDLPEAEQAVTEWFEIEQGDPGEIVQVLRLLLGAEDNGGRPGRDRGGRRGRDRGRDGRDTTAVVTGPSGAPIILIPHSPRRLIIARAAPDDMKKIKEWIDRLDCKEGITPEYETIKITYANVQEVADRINEMLEGTPGTELRSSAMVQPFEQAGHILVYGRKDLREVIKKLVDTIDIPQGNYIQKTFELEHADAEQIKENIDSLYGEETETSWYLRYLHYRYGKGQQDVVKAVSFPTMNQVTVTATPNTMAKIEEHVQAWDIPIDPNDVRPLILTLDNTDPVKMADLLNKLFSEEDVGIWERYFEARFGRSMRNIVGPLYGQLTFEEVPGTKKIVVISKMPEAYRIIRDFVIDLDKQEMAEVPKIVTLKYADPEDLCVRLNAMFNEPGTQAPIWFTETGLSESKYSMGEKSEGGNPGGDSSEEGTSRQEYNPPWGGAPRRDDQMPISNIIGRIRFIPDPRSKSILVLSPREYVEPVVQTIKELDVPGKQVRIKATILEVDHRDLTTLGVQLASDPTVFGTLSENEITALTQLTQLSTRGTSSFTEVAPLGAEGEGLAFRTGTTVTALIDFLVKKVDARILNQQTLWTKDNQEANFFKGQTVAFNTDISVSGTGERVTSGLRYDRVGMELRVRPKITPENNVDMIINLVISQLTPEEISGQRVRNRVDTETKMIVDDSETVMLGGMLFQEDSAIERKIPLLSDLPLLGGLFSHSETAKVNTETLVFVTPYVVDERTKEEAKEQIEQERERLKETLEELNESVRGGRRG